MESRGERAKYEGNPWVKNHGKGRCHFHMTAQGNPISEPSEPKNHENQVSGLTGLRPEPHFLDFFSCPSWRIRSPWHFHRSSLMPCQKGAALVAKTVHIHMFQVCAGDFRSQELDPNHGQSLGVPVWFTCVQANKQVLNIADGAVFAEHKRCKGSVLPP